MADDEGPCVCSRRRGCARINADFSFLNRHPEVAAATEGPASQRILTDRARKSFRSWITSKIAFSELIVNICNQIEGRDPSNPTGIRHISISCVLSPAS